MIGNVAGSQPAMTALTASFSSETCRHMGGMAPSTVVPSRVPSIASTLSGVGGTMGNPSVHCRAVNSVNTTLGAVTAASEMILTPARSSISAVMAVTLTGRVCAFAGSFCATTVTSGSTMRSGF